MPEITVNMNLSREQALDFAKRLARDDAFRKEIATNPHGALEQYGIRISGDEVRFNPILPPKHVVEEALVNVVEASEFASHEGFQSQDAFAFWMFVVFIAT